MESVLLIFGCIIKKTKIKVVKEDSLWAICLFAVLKESFNVVFICTIVSVTLKASSFIQRTKTKLKLIFSFDRRSESKHLYYPKC